MKIIYNNLFNFGLKSFLKKVKTLRYELKKYKRTYYQND